MTPCRWTAGRSRVKRAFTLVFCLVFGAAVSVSATEPSPRPVLAFITQTPNPLGAMDFATVTAAYGSHRGTTEAAPRGGSLHILYDDGSSVDILDAALKAACDIGAPECDPRGAREVNEDGLLVHGVAVRTPVIHWDGDRVLFAMSVGAVQHENRWRTHEFKWRLFEIEGLAHGATPLIREIPHQPDDVNNLDPAYGSIEGEIIFTSDLPVTRDMRHYPPLDEYESTPTVSGLWKLNEFTGALQLLEHSPSGAFEPFVDRNGHVVYTRWDHLQADQQANDALRHVADGAIANRFQPYTYENENQFGPDFYETVERRIVSALDAPQIDEVRAFDLGEPYGPEPHRFNPAYVDPTLHGEGVVFGTHNGASLTTRAPRDASGRAFRPFLMATFTPWQINQDGREHKSLRHIGRHELLEYLNGTFVADSSLDEMSNERTVWPFHLSEDPQQRGRYLGNTSLDARRHAAGAIFTLTDALSPVTAGEHENAEALALDWLTDPEGDTLFRDPVLLTDGTLFASVDRVPLSEKTSNMMFDAFDFQLFRLNRAPTDPYYAAEATPVAGPFTAAFSYYEGGGSGRLRAFDGALWVLGAVEIAVRSRPPMPAPQSSTDVETVLAGEGVTQAALSTFLADNGLAAVIVRNATRRDDIDRQQPYNLYVDHPTAGDGAESIVDASCTEGILGCLYGVRYLQIFENKLLRGYERRAKIVDGVFSDNGRRGLVRPMDHPLALDWSAQSGAGEPPAAALVAPDGSVAVLAPAGRAISWNLADANGDAIVRERVWVTLQPGEVRVCNGCHGANTLDQTGADSVSSDLLALKILIENLKSNGLPATP